METVTKLCSILLCKLRTSAAKMSYSGGSLPEASTVPALLLDLDLSEDSVKLEKRDIKVPVAKSKRLRNILTPKISVKKSYFTAGRRINDENREILEAQPSPFSYPGDMEEFAQKLLTKAWRNDVRLKEMKLKCYQQPSYMGRQTKGLLNRLYVKEPPIKTVQSILQVDPKYFSIVEGRSVITKRMQIRDYMQMVRNSLRTKIAIGYREDDIMLMEEKLRTEQQTIDIIKENYRIYVDTFEEFLLRDHTSAMALLDKEEEAKTKCYMMYTEYKSASKLYGALRASMFNLEEKWRRCKLYQRFLYTVSPLSWRENQKCIVEDDDNENIFGKFRKSLGTVENQSLIDIVNLFEQELTDDSPAQLYFTNPQQLMDVFRFIEMQNLNSLLHSEEVAVPLDAIKNNTEKAMEILDKDIKSVQETIDKLEGGIKWEEKRVNYLEEVALKLIDVELKKLLKDDQVLNLHVFVEDVYETRVAPNDANLNMVDMMRGIEEKYRSELRFLDEIPSEQVTQLEGGFYAERVLVMRLAERAAKQYAELERLTNNLNKAFAPPYEKPKGKDLKKRSRPLMPPERPKTPIRELTEDEAEYLEYFTDFCKNTDNPSDYGIDIKQHEQETSKDKKMSRSRSESRKEEGGKLLTIVSQIINAQAKEKRR